ncbi:hypothetical protein ABW21_db0206959 [Orbilia brochopaga]|nr:hypothetical protein ABW21_db0206959 [Drechslerella brochopaga]
MSLRHTIRSLLTGPQAQAQALPNGSSQSYAGRQAHALPAHDYHNYPSTASSYQDIPTSPPPPYVQSPHHGQNTLPHPSIIQTSSPLETPAPSNSDYSTYPAPNKQEYELLNNLARPNNEPQPTASTAQSRDISSPTLRQGSCAATGSTTVAASEPSSPGVPASFSTPSGIIHPSLLAQWTAATKRPSLSKSPPSGQTQSYSQELPPKSNSPITSQAARPGHDPTSSVNRSLTFSKMNADGTPNWSGLLLTIDGLPSETFTRFVDGIYNYAGLDDDPLGLTPDQMRVLLERLEIPDEDNHPKRLALRAHRMQAGDPVTLVNTSMIQFYTTFNLTYITEANLMPLITRDGFQQYMISNVLVDPSAMHICFNRLLAKFGHYIIDPPTKKPFGSVQIDRICYPAVPNDQYVSLHQKQTEALTAKENMDIAGYGHHHQGDSTNSNPHGAGYRHQSSWGI